ncbi:Transglutaminase [Georgfuchsia toluolica]|uniref:Transglutaminase n=1 Tax=Georgfuchsia toluolica TaxID=424218 RepID=A0A916J5H2_9PROT|nr:transglutaminase family protein [Georgfuchsia toluolica]CAG4884312.1 Transglutaminase [Georgfuchsia toluolica]
MIHTPAGEYPLPGPEYLASTPFLDFDSPSLRSEVDRIVAGAASDIEKAIRLYYWVRDGWRYDPFSIRLNPESYVASNIHRADHGYCIPKAILLTAAARAAGIPAALGFSDVSNHLTSEKLKRWMGGNDVFVYHGYAVLHLNDKWVKAAPAFNLDLCQRFGVHPTEFDGRSDALFQEFDMQNRRHMEYVANHGCWSDFPYEIIAAGLRAAYPVDTWGLGIEAAVFSPN